MRTKDVHLDMLLSLMDRQILDRRGRMVGKVDDVVVEQRPDGRWVVVGLQTGPGALGPRLPGWIARPLVGAWRRLSRRDAPATIAMDLVADLGSAVTLSITRAETDVDGLEDWVREHLVRRIPGASDDPEH
ncbi:hypothetical protein [Mumia sp. Pv 4-285]|uniref:hypothetical protein n=1 Tax=Mumia qirimensis TaxID=3234852 RepID=UPI00351D5F62